MNRIKKLIAAVVLAIAVAIPITIGNTTVHAYPASCRTYQPTSTTVYGYCTGGTGHYQVRGLCWDWTPVEVGGLWVKTGPSGVSTVNCNRVGGIIISSRIVTTNS